MVKETCRQYSIIASNNFILARKLSIYDYSVITYDCRNFIRLVSVRSIEPSHSNLAVLSVNIIWDQYCKTFMCDGVVFLFHNSHKKFDGQTIVSNQINQIESWKSNVVVLGSNKGLSRLGGCNSSVVLSAPTILQPRGFESQAHHQSFFQFVLKL